MRRLNVLLVLVAGLLPGCRSSAPASAADGGDRTREMTLRVPMSYGTGEVTAAGLRLAVIAEAECLTVQPCDARGVRLTFLNRSTRDVRLRFVPVEIVADGQVFRAPTPDVPQNQEYVPSGAFFSTLLQSAFVPLFAGAQDVSIRLGQTTVTLSHSERRPVRDLLARMTAGGDGGNGGR